MIVFESQKVTKSGESNDGTVPGKEILFVEMNGFHKSFHSLRIAGVFTDVFA